MVFMPYYFDPEKDDHPISQPISTGLACHLSLEEAQLGAICEVTERDAVMITWLGMLSPPQVNLETIPEPNADLIRRFQRAGYTINVLDLTFDHKVPTFLSVLRGGTLDVPPLNLAAASSLDSSEALRKSLEELAHTRLYCYRIQHSINRLVPDPPNFASVSEQLSHINM
jgi:ribosomal protein S12 methylthiotransferase accessory factor